MEQLKEMPIRIPMDGTFELTVRCNLKCKMCLFKHDDSENKFIVEKEKTADEWIDMARQVANAGTLSLLITGGEPLLRADFPKIYEEIHKMGFIITLYTNATLITDKIKELLIKYPPHKIGVTVYGSCPEVYEKVCGNKNAFYKMMKGIQFLKTLPSKIEARCTVIKDNYNDIDNIENLVKREFGEKSTLIQSRMVYKPVRGACGDVESCRLTPKENVRLFLRRGLDEVKKAVERDGLDINSVSLKFERQKYEASENASKKDKLTLLGCDGGMDSYTISWDGKLLGCQMLENFYTEPFKVGFEKAWKIYPFEVKIPKFDDECLKCEHSEICNACYACRYAETGSLSGVPKYVCDDLKELLGLIKIQ